ncbi:hypothetical protein LINPERHAP2_LOCUS28375 [Linum perenne]
MEAQRNTTPPPPPPPPPSSTALQTDDGQLPLDVSLTIQCDGSFQEDIQKAGLGVIVSDPNGHIIDGRAGSFFCRTPSVAEAFAVLNTVKLAQNLNMQVLIKSDCREVIDALSKPLEECPWEITAIIADIVEITQGWPQIKIKHCRRTEVSQAHRIANLVRVGLLLPNWLANM